MSALRVGSLNFDRAQEIAADDFDTHDGELWIYLADKRVAVVARGAWTFAQFIPDAPGTDTP